MGIDSGLPDFRGPGGFWSVYPALGRARVSFESIANPTAFENDPRLAWGFYGHRLALYRKTPPHAGFALLRELAKGMPHGLRAFTSNVDGQFQKAGFGTDLVCEIHGSIHHLQCAAGCGEHIWTADDFHPEIDTDNCRLRNELPHCPHCGALARPNILMFGDWGWVDRRTMLQYHRLQQWLATVDRLVCIEIGAGTNIPTVRHFSENCNGRLIRINPGEPEVPDPATGIGLAMGGLAGIVRLHTAFASD
ncbi:MAG: NAD-dependent deacetylase [Betaproteobacteria bacterium HGW-Betaproteobacteria-6]|nr:MAG: NAD-dependent deacetylase [Betaproteobacteria bacterium HGW-Betaproteobacteria-6]